MRNPKLLPQYKSIQYLKPAAAIEVLEQGQERKVIGSDESEELLDLGPTRAECDVFRATKFKFIVSLRDSQTEIIQVDILARRQFSNFKHLSLYACLYRYLKIISQPIWAGGPLNTTSTSRIPAFWGPL